MKVFSGSANRELAQRICDYIGTPLGQATISSFPDGETYVKIEELITTNSTPVRPVDGFKTTVLCISELLGEGMKRIHNDESVSSLFKIDNDAEKN